MKQAKPIVWSRKHLLGLRQLSAEEITYILDTAHGFEEISKRSIKKTPTLRGKLVVNLFFEAVLKEIPQCEMELIPGNDLFCCGHSQPGAEVDSARIRLQVSRDEVENSAFARAVLAH